MVAYGDGGMRWLRPVVGGDGWYGRLDGRHGRRTAAWAAMAAHGRHGRYARCLVRRDILPYFEPDLANCVQCHSRWHGASRGVDLDSYANHGVVTTAHWWVAYDSQDATALLVPKLEAITTTVRTTLVSS